VGTALAATAATEGPAASLTTALFFLLGVAEAAAAASFLTSDAPALLPESVLTPTLRERV
jgi:hypothetical protein